MLLEQIRRLNQDNDCETQCRFDDCEYDSLEDLQPTSKAQTPCMRRPVAAARLQ